MDGPTAAKLTFNAGLKPFTTKSLDQRRREKRRNNRKSFARSECIDTFTDFRKWLDAALQDWTNIECFKLACRHDQLFLPVIETQPGQHHQHHRPHYRHRKKPDVGV